LLLPRAARRTGCARDARGEGREGAHVRRRPRPAPHRDAWHADRGVSLLISGLEKWLAKSLDFPERFDGNLSPQNIQIPPLLCAARAPCSTPRRYAKSSALRR